MELKAHPRFDSQLAYWFSAIVLLVLIGVRLKYPLWTSPHIDLDVYLRGGSDAFSGRDAIYDTQDGRLPFTYPPIAALFFGFFTFLPRSGASLALTLLSFAALVGITRMWLRASTQSRYLFARTAFTRYAFVVGLSAFALLLQPVGRTLDLGQINLLLCCVLTFDMLYARSERTRGLLVGIATGFKLTPGIFIIWFAITRQWRACINACIGFFCTVALGALFLPKSTWKYWTETFFDAERVGGLAYSGNQSLNGAIWRALGEGGSKAIWLVLVAITSVCCLWFALRAFRKNRRAESVLIVALWGLLVSPVSWDHHWVWLWPATLVFGAYAVSHTNRSFDGDRSRFSVLQNLRGYTRMAIAICVALFVMVAAQLTDLIWVMPNSNDREYHVSVLGKVLTDAYAILAIMSLALLAVVVQRPLREKDSCGVQ